MDHGDCSETLHELYHFLDGELTDALQPLLQATGVPTHKAFLFASWSPLRPLTIT